MLTILSLILTGICLLIIIAIIIKKFPTLAILNVGDLPGEKEAKFKDQIIKQRVERDLARWGGNFARLWLVVNRYLSGFLKTAQTQLKKIKLNYKSQTRLPWPEKQKRLKELFIAADDLLKKEANDEAEEKLVEIISLDQKNLTAFFKLAGLYEEERKWSEARQTYEYALKLARQYQNDESIMADLTLPEIYFSLAKVEKETEDLAASLENVREALDLEPNNPRYLDLILDLSIMRKDKELASEYLAKLATVNPENNKLGDWQEKINSLTD